MALLATLIVILVAGALAGYFIGRRYAPSREKIEALETELTETHTKLTTYQDSVTEHFHKTAGLFADLTRKYQDVYSHLAEGAHELCNDVNLQEALSYSKPDLEAEQTAAEQMAAVRFEEIIPERQEPFIAEPKNENSEAPKDYAVEAG